MEELPAIHYKSYSAKVTYDDSVQAFQGRTVGMVDGITCQADTIDDLEHEFKESIEDYLEWCEERGKSPDYPWS